MTTATALMKGGGRRMGLRHAFQDIYDGPYNIIPLTDCATGREAAFT